MVVCLCQGVSEKHVRRAIEGGAQSRREVTRACGAGGVCGGCHSTIAEMIRDCAGNAPAGLSEARPVATCAPALAASAA